ncbi:Xax1 transposase (plasmid) [Xanthomonas citri pv. fuscans]|nr:Xax1 transposase [Xanthomonas citri pv. fuscans]
MSPRTHEVPDELLSSLLVNYTKPEDLIGENGLLKQLTKRLVERALDAEMTEHLGHDKHEPVANAAGNTRNGRSRKTLKGEFGELPIEIPRDRHGSFAPQLIPKHQTRWAGFDDKILSLYARGMTVREIQSHLEEMYGTEVFGHLRVQRPLHQPLGQLLEQAVLADQILGFGVVDQQAAKQLVGYLMCAWAHGVSGLGGSLLPVARLHKI